MLNLNFFHFFYTLFWVRFFNKWGAFKCFFHCYKFNNTVPFQFNTVFLNFVHFILFQQIPKNALAQFVKLPHFCNVNKK
jgi:hypothetical protein